VDVVQEASAVGTISWQLNQAACALDCETASAHFKQSAGTKQVEICRDATTSEGSMYTHALGEAR
jgi:hypothetical protein